MAATSSPRTWGCQVAAPWGQPVAGSWGQGEDIVIGLDDARDRGACHKGTRPQPVALYCLAYTHCFLSQRIIRAKEAQDSIGGTVTCVIRGVPAGLGEPVFDKLEAKLAHAMLSIPATKGFEIGSGFHGTEIPGSRHNDAFVRKEDGSIGTETNWSGGIQGGITNGEDIYFR